MDSNCLEVYSWYIPITLWNNIRNSFHICTSLTRICFALNLSDMWLFMAIRASDKSLLNCKELAVLELYSVSDFTRVTVLPYSMPGDSVESSKNSGPWIPDHSWRFIVDQDPVSSNQGASAVHGQLRGGAIQPLYMGKKLKILNVVRELITLSITGHRSCIL